MSEPRAASVGDVPELVRVINLAYRVEDFFINGDRTNDSDVQRRMATPDAGFLVVDDTDPGRLAAAPVAVFESAVLRSSDPAPTAVLKLPVVTLNNENVPIAVFPRPKVRA